jgi:NAD(P)H-flavin reductase
MTITDLLAILAVVVSAISSTIVFLNFRKDKGIFEVSAYIASEGAKSYVNIHVSNVGIRPITIKDVGYIDWELGMYCCPVGSCDNYNKTLKEAESIDIKLPLDGTFDIEKVRKILIRDHSNKNWYATNNSMKKIYRYVYGHDSRFGNDKGFIKLDDLDKYRNKSLFQYLKFIKKNNVENKLRGKITHPHNSLNKKLAKEFLVVNNEKKN